ncbi:hypothetical protein LAZ67_5000592 [Cordylochernes scorpioides]|uniref:Reverse transcriptase domain-containing protein n=1 Tax=Cordylochernes scorpioides TaxID=51811 RepID=A0ABY6KFU3_9ARAC|nr:hypothetical protein LAZ67_5000592 [Cordylochernes scorpioides]
MVVDRLTDIILEAAYQLLEVNSSNFTFDTGIKWWNKELEQKKKYFHYVRNLYFHHKAISVNEYKSVRNKYKNSIRKAKRNSWRDFREENGSNNPFGNAYRTLKKPSSSNQQKGLPIIEQAPVDSKESLIKDLINELIPDDTTISDTAHHTSIRNYTPNFTNSNSCNIHKKEIEELIDKINVNKAPGPDNISNNMIKNAFQLILPILHSIFNKGIQIGYFPKKWKTAALKIIAKPGKTNYESAKSYRPISLLSNFSKILEKILKNKLYEFYIQNNLLSSRQHGFIKSKSTITALNTVIDVLMEHKQKELSALVTIDISGAFDNAWWPAIIKRIDSDNLPVKLIKILQSYLNSRTISFSYDNLTTSKPITKGCPQGGPLSPLLWTILLDDLLLNFQVPNRAVNVYNKFIPDYARLRAPLNKLLKKDVKWNWDPDSQQAFTTLKESLTSKPVLHLYQVGLPCRLYCDASTQGIAGILKQVNPDGQVHPVQYFSRALRAHERNYTVSELECLAIFESVEKFRIYLTGIKFTIYTDHQALQWLKTILKIRQDDSFDGA